MSKPAIAAAVLACGLSTAALLRGPSQPEPARPGEECQVGESLAWDGANWACAPAARLPRCTMVDGDEHAGTIDVRDTDVTAGCWVAFPKPFATVPACDVTTEDGVHVGHAPALDRLVIPSARFGMRLRFTCHEGR